MKLLFILFIFSVFGLKNSNAQNSTNVIYTKHLYKQIPDGRIAPEESFTRLSFNDSLAYYYYLADYFKKAICSKKKLGNKLQHHTSYTKYSDGNLIKYETVAWPSLSKKYLIEDTIHLNKWVYTNKTKQVLNYDCKMAYMIEDGGNDTTLVWYTEKLKGKFGPPKTAGHPGVVLEVINQKYGTHEFAKEISQCATEVLFPENPKKITLKDHQAIKESKNDKQGYKIGQVDKSFVKQLKIFQIL